MLLLLLLLFWLHGLKTLTAGFLILTEPKSNQCSWITWSLLASFLQESSNCDATRASMKLESHHSYYSLGENCWLSSLFHWILKQSAVKGLLDNRFLITSLSSDSTHTHTHTHTHSHKHTQCTFYIRGQHPTPRTCSWVHVYAYIKASNTSHSAMTMQWFHVVKYYS